MRRAGALLGVVGLLLAGCSTVTPPAGSSGPDRPSPSSPGRASSSPSVAGFTNPVLGQGADPFVTVVRGRYYYVQSAGGTGVSLRSSDSLATLQDAPATEIVRPSGGAPCCEYWAPEVHRIGSSWYVYVAADDGDNDHHRTYVFKAPKITGPYAFAGKLTLPGDRWAIDATVLTGHGGPYVIWSGWPGPTNGEQDIYLAELSSPTASSGHAVRLSRPRYGWETRSGTVGVKVNEGPAALEHGGKIFITYSASGCWTPDYALGMLTADASADLLQASSWHKSATPVFSGGASSGEYGTGHNSFFTSPDGSQTWSVYHAVTDAAGSCGDDREVYAQPVTFPGGVPDLGRPSGRQQALPLPAGDPGP